MARARAEQGQDKGRAWAGLGQGKGMGRACAGRGKGSARVRQGQGKARVREWQGKEQEKGKGRTRVLLTFTVPDRLLGSGPVGDNELKNHNTVVSVFFIFTVCPSVPPGPSSWVSGHLSWFLSPPAGSKAPIEPPIEQRDYLLA